MLARYAVKVFNLWRRDPATLKRLYELADIGAMRTMERGLFGIPAWRQKRSMTT